MPRYILAVRSARCTFSISYEAQDAGESIEQAGKLIAKAHVGSDALVTVSSRDGTEIDVEGRLASFFDKPPWSNVIR